VVPSDRTRGNGHKLKHGSFPLSIRKHFFIVSKQWHRLPKEVVVSPSLAIFKTCLGVAMLEQGSWTR